MRVRPGELQSVLSSALDRPRGDARLFLTSAPAFTRLGHACFLPGASRLGNARVHPSRDLDGTFVQCLVSF